MDFTSTKLAGLLEIILPTGHGPLNELQIKSGMSRAGFQIVGPTTFQSQCK